MGIKSIKYSEAVSLANMVADKAFEHILGPLLKAEKELAQRAYDAAIEDAGLTRETFEALRDLGILDKYEGCSVDFECEEENRHLYRVHIGLQGRWKGGSYVNEGDAGRTYVTSRLTIRNPDYVKEHAKLREKINPIEAQHRDLVSEIRMQVEGKSASAVKKAWPQVAPFVDAVFGATSGNPMTIPFEDLIGRFLALPAPQAA